MRVQRECELTRAEMAELVHKADRAAAEAQARAGAEADAHKRLKARLAEVRPALPCLMPSCVLCMNGSLCEGVLAGVV